jgi:hypothetical protein
LVAAFTILRGLSLFYKMERSEENSCSRARIKET